MSLVLLIEQDMQCEGYFERGLLKGHGKLSTADGRCYEGEFNDNKPHGTGKLTFADGSSYEGGKRQ